MPALTRILLHRVATTSIMLRRPPAAACPCSRWYLGLEQNGSQKEAGSSSKVAGESSGSTMEQKKGLHSSGATSEQVHESLAAVLEENILVGRESDESNLIGIIQKNKSKGHVCVFGGAGIGKTALVKSVCQSEKLSGMFERIVWVTMPDPSDYHESNRTVKLKSDLKKKRTDAFRSANKVQRRTDEKDSSPAKGNLIVIDDVSSKKDYDIIKSALLDPQSNMSQVIIITRDSSIAGSCDHHLPLESLEYEDAFELFRKKVKVDLDGKNLSGIAQIVEKCGGNPHIIISVANSLQNNTIKEWKKACDHLSAKLLNDPKLKDTKRRLTSSYKNLPSDLKSCFLYLSVFPEDSIIRRRCLVRRWIAEGYSSEKPGKSAEDVAEEQFQHLVSRNMIRPYRTRAIKLVLAGRLISLDWKLPCMQSA
ncbi:hypothetical protein BS78_K271700 [Paspalum vaginatum]|uniref:AAA+ ATPase domain-containing protein n=1 Tax=Paspalum vaginatum TaxID=158149 RepID=A0A9W7XB00_9POAL|nr:hypothetical protein BS78_K271700 [Paspalum vaginatum]